MPPIGLAINPAEKVKNYRIRAVVGGVDSEKNTNGNTRAAAVAYRKKSYQSILAPANAVSATLRILDFKRSSSSGLLLVVAVVSLVMVSPNSIAASEPVLILEAALSA